MLSSSKSKSHDLMHLLIYLIFVMLRSNIQLDNSESVVLGYIPSQKFPTLHCVRSSSQTVFELRAEYRSLVS